MTWFPWWIYKLKCLGRLREIPWWVIRIISKQKKAFSLLGRRALGDEGKKFPIRYF